MSYAVMLYEEIKFHRAEIEDPPDGKMQGGTDVENRYSKTAGSGKPGRGWKNIWIPAWKLL